MQYMVGQWPLAFLSAFLSAFFSDLSALSAALAGTAFQPGVMVRRAAEDTERMRGIFKTTVGKPTMTILHGQSWGASVAAKAAELYTRETVGEKPM